MLLEYSQLLSNRTKNMKNFSKNCTIDLVGSSYFWEELKKFSSYEEKKEEV